jgi:hypothetical protein
MGLWIEGFNYFNDFSLNSQLLEPLNLSSIFKRIGDDTNSF